MSNSSIAGCELYAPVKTLALAFIFAPSFAGWKFLLRDFHRVLNVLCEHNGILSFRSIRGDISVIRF